MKKTLEQKLHERQVHKPNFVLYNFLGYLWKYSVARKYQLETEFIDNPKKEKGAYVLVSNHASRADYIFTAVPLLPQTFNFVVGYNEFFRSHLAPILKLLQEIPKKNFTPDLYPIMQMKKIVSNGGRIQIFLEGMSSISGGSQPIALGGAKLLKWLNVPVYISNIKGGYLTAPKYNLTDRPGKVKVTFKKLFSREDLATYSTDEITDILNKEIRTDDYAYNEVARTYYKSNQIALNINQLLYKCPKCGAEFEMTSSNSSFKCNKCGNEVEMDNYYTLKAKDNSITLKNPKVSFCVVDDDTIVPEKFTTYFKSVIVYGSALIVNDEDERRKAFDALANKYSKDVAEHLKNEEIRKAGPAALIVRIDIEHMSGKKAIEYV